MSAIPQSVNRDESVEILRRLEPLLVAMNDRLVRLEDRLGRVESEVAEVKRDVRRVEIELAEMKGRLSEKPNMWQTTGIVFGCQAGTVGIAAMIRFLLLP
jgi:predicted  nucleic acid-binding Zn-ribbon protein